MDDPILIFGGTFDPPHLAHTALPPLVARRLDCKRILYIPAAANPLKTDAPPTAVEHRLAMLRLALADVPDAEISTIELDRRGPSYMVETLQTLRKQLGSDIELRLLIGSDQALTFHRWKDWSRILDLATPAVMVRPPLDEQTFGAQLADACTADETRRWLNWSTPVPQMDICATDLRRRLAAGDDVRGLLSPDVLRYIRGHGLYESASG